jgi:hypothetical protein
MDGEMCVRRKGLERKDLSIGDGEEMESRKQG